MIAEFGHYALVLALALALVQASVPIVGARKNDPVLMAVAGPTAIAQLLFVAIAFGALTICYVRSDFSVINVFENSHSAKPLIYKISGVWGNHEGSMLLWVLILSLFGALVALFGGNLPARLKANVLAVQSSIAVAFVLFILVTSNPFLRILEPPLEGRDLNPILQDPGLAIHPPLLYLGYVGLSIAFSFAIAALIDGRIDAAWARWVRPWTLLAWMFLTLGIAMGSYWAYYTLGWGGWWFWDPVENSSFMPWLAATALLHSAIVTEKRGSLGSWTVFLALVAFTLSMRGAILLGCVAVAAGSAFSLFAWRAPQLKSGGLFAPISREGTLVLNNLFLSTACLTVFVGTLYPLALEALTGEKISVGAPFFNLTFAPLFIPLMFAMPFGPLMAWKRGDVLGVAQRLTVAFGTGIVAVAATFAIAGRGSALAPFGIGLAVFVMIGAGTDVVERIGLFREPLSTVRRRASGLPRSAWGTALAHFGVGVTLLGIVSVTTWASERIVALKPSQTVSLADYELTFDGLAQRTGPNYREAVAKFTVREAGVPVGVMEPSKRNFASRATTTTEAALMTRGVSQLYLSLGDTSGDGSVSVRLYHKPMVLLIWLGAVAMAMGGGLSLSDRRLRVGAPKPAAKPAMLPAE